MAFGPFYFQDTEKTRNVEFSLWNRMEKDPMRLDKYLFLL